MKKLPLKASALFYLHFILNMGFCQIALSQSSVELISRAGLFNFGEIPFSLLVPIIMVTFWPLYFHFASINKTHHSLSPVWWFIIAILISLPTIPHIFLFTRDFIPFPFLESYLAVQRLLIFFHVLYISLWQLFIIFWMSNYNRPEHSRGFWILLTLTIAYFILLGEISHILIIETFHIPSPGQASVGIRFFVLFYKFLTYPYYVLLVLFNISIACFFDSLKPGIREDFFTFLPALHIYIIICAIIFYESIKILLNNNSRITA